MAQDQVTDGPRGIGGWLVLPIIGLVVTVLLTAYNLLVALGDLGGEALVVLRQSYPGVLALMVISLVAGLCLIAYAAYCLKLIFTEDERAPRAMITYYAALVGVTAFETFSIYYMARQFGQPDLTEGAGTDLVRSVVIAAIWIPYFVNSKRVRNTFVKQA